MSSDSGITNYNPPWNATASQPNAPGDHNEDSLRIFYDHHGSILDEDTGEYSTGYTHSVAKGTDSQWSLFFSNYALITEEQYNTDPYYYHGLFGIYWRDWYENTLTSSQRTSYQNNQYNVSSSGLASSWNSYLENSDLVYRQRSSFQWAYNLMINFTQELQTVMLYQANRSGVLSDAQSDAISAMSVRVSAYISKGGSASSQADWNATNMEVSADIGIYQSKSQTISDSMSNITNDTSATSNNSKNTSSMMNSIIQNMTAILKGIFS